MTRAEATTLRAPTRIDSAGRTVPVGGGTEVPDRFLIGHLAKSMLVSESNSTIEDHARVFGLSQGHFLLLAGGFGEPTAAAAAAETALDVMASQLVNHVPWFFGLDVDLGPQLTAALETAVARCHEAVQRQVPAGPAEGRTAGATLTAVYLLWPRMYVLHLGDNRCYLVRDGDARLLTRDHTRGVEASAPDAPAGAPRRVLTNALGAGIPQPSADVLRVGLEVGDSVVLCTAGTGAPTEARNLARTVHASPTAEAAAERLVRQAAGLRARPAATAVVARFTAEPPDPGLSAPPARAT